MNISTSHYQDDKVTPLQRPLCLVRCRPVSVAGSVQKQPRRDEDRECNRAGSSSVQPVQVARPPSLPLDGLRSLLAGNVIGPCSF